jgi:DNA-binding transcriptional MerR regulator
MENSDRRRYPIGELARRTGLPVRTIRFWSDAGVVPPAGRTPAGHRLYDDAALARLELVVTLRQLGVGLDTIRAVLEKRTTVAEVAGLHARALETEIRGLKLRRAVLVSIANQRLDVEGMKMVNDLARLTAAERQQLVDDFIAEAFGSVEDASGIGERMRVATPALPDDPTQEQVDAWIEVATLVRDPSFRDRVRRMAHAGAGQQEPFDREAGKAFAARVAEFAGPAAERGVDPASQEAAEILDRIVHDDKAKRSEVAEQLSTFASGRVNRYWELVGIINGWPPFRSTYAAYDWVIAALKAHS